MREKKNESKLIRDGVDQEHRLKRFLFIHELLRRYMSGTASQKEKQLLSGWKPSEQDGPFPALRPEEEKEADRRIYRQVSEKLRLEQGGNRKVSRPGSSGAVRFRLNRYAAAAVVAVLIGCGVYWLTGKGSLHPEDQFLSPGKSILYQAGNGETKRVTLPDGTVVQLNSNTTLSLDPSAFNKKRREVRIADGEAFFEVARSEKKPFVVYSKKLTTTVKGTSFNMKVYGILDEAVVTVRTGIVEVADGKQVLDVLTANRQITFNTGTERFQSREVNWKDAVGWTEGRLVLYDAGLKELKFRLQQQFGLEVRVSEGVLENVRFTASFEQGAGLQDIMEVLDALYGVKYEANDKILIINR